jgi:hypothetical protein
VRSAENGGAVAVLMAVAAPVDSPARPLPAAAPIMLDIPVLTLSGPDASAIAQVAQRREVMASLGGEPTQPLGADRDGRPYLYATRPVREGSSISHFDPLGRPDLLMEPYTTLPAKHNVDLTLPALLDMGWASVRCGNGQIDDGETCDDGALMSDRASDACRTNCTLARCGDGVIDSAEQCDDGLRNDDTQPGACRRDCSPARCGDGVVDPGEACDGATDCADDCRETESGGSNRSDGETEDSAALRSDSSDGCSVAEASSASHGSAAFGLLLTALALVGLRRTRR